MNHLIPFYYAPVLQMKISALISLSIWDPWRYSGSVTINVYVYFPILYFK